MATRRGRGPDVIDVRGRGGGGGLSMGRGVTIPGGLGIAGRDRVPADPGARRRRGSAGGFDVDSPFGPAPAAPAADGGGIPAAQDPERDLKEFSVYVFSNTLDTWDHADEEQGTASSEPRWCCTATPYPPGAATLVGGRPVLLPRRSARLSGPQLLRGHGDGARRARRLRLGIRDRARGRPPRTAAARDEHRGDAAPARAPRPGERAVGAPRAPGRLLFGRVGAQRLRGGRPREGRRARRQFVPLPPSATTACSAAPTGR